MCRGVKGLHVDSLRWSKSHELQTVGSAARVLCADRRHQGVVSKSGARSYKNPPQIRPAFSMVHCTRLYDESIWRRSTVFEIACVRHMQDSERWGARVNAVWRHDLLNLNSGHFFPPSSLLPCASLSIPASYPHTPTRAVDNSCHPSTCTMPPKAKRSTPKKLVRPPRKASGGVKDVVQQMRPASRANKSARPEAVAVIDRDSDAEDSDREVRVVMRRDGTVLCSSGCILSFFKHVQRIGACARAQTWAQRSRR